MNAITPRRTPQALPPVPPVPKPSPALLKASKEIGWDQAGVYSLPGVPGFFAEDRRMPPAEVIQEAQALVAAIDRVLAPANSPAAVRAWLRPIAAGVRNPPTEGDFNASAAAIALVCAELPQISFTLETQKQALSTFQFWPSAAEVRELMANEAARFKLLRMDVVKVATVRPMADYTRLYREQWQRQRSDREAYHTGPQAGTAA